MLFCGAPLQSVDSVVMYSATAVEGRYKWEPTRESSTLTPGVMGFEVGRTYYRLIRPVDVDQKLFGQHWVCYVAELSAYKGVGKTQQEAEEELKIAIHTDFQQLDRKRPFEMDEGERARWLQLTNMIDLLHYKMTTPVETREIGQVSFEKISRPYSIKWLSGRKYTIDPYKVPGELMSCRPGQWIEAIVKRDPVTHREIEIESIRRISFRIPQESDVKAFWENLPKAELEPTAWAW